jgi:hypothetical protein
MRRIVAKLEKYGPSNVQRVTDTRRASIVCDDFTVMAAVLAAMNRLLSIFRLKNRFCAQVRAVRRTPYATCTCLALSATPLLPLQRTKHAHPRT